MITVFGHYVRQRRELLGLSQTALAREIGTHQPEVSRWERGLAEPKMASVKRIAKALSVKPSELLKFLL